MKGLPPQLEPAIQFTEEPFVYAPPRPQTPEPPTIENMSRAGDLEKTPRAPGRKTNPMAPPPFIGFSSGSPLSKRAQNSHLLTSRTQDVEMDDASPPATELTPRNLSERPSLLSTMAPAINITSRPSALAGLDPALKNLLPPANPFPRPPPGYRNYRARGSLTFNPNPPHPANLLADDEEFCEHTSPSFQGTRCPAAAAYIANAGAMPTKRAVPPFVPTPSPWGMGREGRTNCYIHHMRAAEDAFPRVEAANNMLHDMLQDREEINQESQLLKQQLKERLVRHDEMWDDGKERLDGNEDDDDENLKALGRTPGPRDQDMGVASGFGPALDVRTSGLKSQTGLGQPFHQMNLSEGADNNNMADMDFGYDVPVSMANVTSANFAVPRHTPAAIQPNGLRELLEFYGDYRRSLCSLSICDTRPDDFGRHNNCLLRHFEQTDGFKLSVIKATAYVPTHAFQATL